MELLLIRHAHAEPADGKATSADTDRALTARSKERFAREVDGMAKLELKLDRLVHSPWLRAAQTAALLRPIVAGKIAASKLVAAEPGRKLLALLGDLPRSARIGVVGHEPWLTDLAGLLCFGAAHHGEHLLLKKGGVLHLEGEPIESGMILQAAFTPRALRRIGH